MTTKYLNTILNELNYDFSTFTLTGFIKHLSQHTGRTINLQPLPIDAHIFGAWISDAECSQEYIFYRESLLPVHIQHTVLHELAHFILGHSTYQATNDELIQIVAQSISLPDTAQYRGRKQSQCEQEAEALANAIWHRVAKAKASAIVASSSSDENDQLLNSLLLVE